MTHPDGLDGLLAEQVAYYRARAPEYDAGALDLPGGDEVVAALDAFAPTGGVVELACGTGAWTVQLLRHADAVTAVDSSPEMLELAAHRVGKDRRVRFVLADLISWRPERRYDVVFFGFWISHVPVERFATFWELVGECLAPGGRVFFADDAYRTNDELVEGRDSTTIERRLEDGTRFRVVKVPHSAAGLKRHLRELGWTIEVHETAGPFYWGAGSPAIG
ncbi:MAG: class I SAM-dependent methyltransferase [Actinomycetota bacterium]|nr:class I SAM-dependent methyltransferase [Actinomycetota bacterium]